MRIDKRGTRHIKVTLGYAETRACEVNDSTGCEARADVRTAARKLADAHGRPVDVFACARRGGYQISQEMPREPAYAMGAS